MPTLSKSKKSKGKGRDANAKWPNGKPGPPKKPIVNPAVFMAAHEVPAPFKWPVPKVISDRKGWPPKYLHVWGWRQDQILKLRADNKLLRGAKEYYRTHPIEFIVHWMDTYDPRNAGKKGLFTRIPFIMFQRQEEFVNFLMAVMQDDGSGLVEKSRDMGATWICCALSIWMWLFQDGVSIGWGSRKEALVDKLGDPDSIFEKMRMLIRYLPNEFLPEGFNERDHMSFMRIVNPETGATVTGEAGDNIGRGGRKRVYFKDESAHYEHPESIEAALMDNTNCQIDISSVNGLGNVFHRRRESGVEWTGDGPISQDTSNIFIMDWSDHPAKDQVWYDKRRALSENAGLLHLFAQEVERNYSASMKGALIKSEWVKAAIDAHIKLRFKDEGGRIAGFDVADEGPDVNAWADRKGIVLLNVDKWADRDPGNAARKALTLTEGLGNIEVHYDCIGVGAGVKSEINRLIEAGIMPKNVTFVPWNAAKAALNPEDNVVSGDEESALIKDFFQNIKAQGWWELSRRLFRTWQAVTLGVAYEDHELISISSEIPLIRTIEKELCQPIMGRSVNTLKMMINKTPEGSSSPNIGDAIMQCYWPIVPEPGFQWYVGGD